VFLPTTKKEMAALGWDAPDIILVTGDTYIDSSYIGAAVIGRVLADHGFRVGIIAQPDVNNPDDIMRLGEPKLCWGVTSGSVDSMVANYTALKKRRMQDDLTAGGINTHRPDRAVIVYSNLIRRYSSKKKPIVLGGIEASLRRIAHYDYWDNRIRRPILFDARADVLVYGMGERAMCAIAECLKNSEPIDAIPGTCHIGRLAPAGYAELPAFEAICRDESAFEKMFKLFALTSCHPEARGLVQRCGERYLIHNPPAEPLSSDELDRVYSLPYERAVHPYYAAQGKVRAMDTITFSITSHRGCYGGCNFCAIALHQGRMVVSRSARSIIDEARRITQLPGFNGFIHDVGGPTANMYGFECAHKHTHDACDTRRCLYPSVCKRLQPDHTAQIQLLHAIKKLPGIKKVFVASGIRCDLLLADKKAGQAYLNEIVQHHVSGQMKIAPEHCVGSVLAAMGKPGIQHIVRFRTLFNELNARAGKKQFLTYYFIAAHPGCTLDDMRKLRDFSARELKHFPEQVQIFTPTPSTFSTLMYYTGRDPFSGKPLFVERDMRRKQQHKDALKRPLHTGGRCPAKSRPPARRKK
jgi:uncharacterized radical SAM protein YgiQ